MKKTLLSVLLAFVLAFTLALAACTNNDTGVTSDSASSSSERNDDSSVSASDSSTDQSGDQSGDATEGHDAYMVTAEEYTAALSPEAFPNATVTFSSVQKINLVLLEQTAETTEIYKIDSENERLDISYEADGGFFGKASNRYIYTKSEDEYYYFFKETDFEKFYKTESSEEDLCYEFENLFDNRILNLVYDSYADLTFDESTDSYCAVDYTFAPYPDFPEETVTLKEFSIKFENGDLISYSYKKSTEGNTETGSCVVSDRGTTVVELPAEDEYVETVSVSFETNGYVYGYVGYSSITIPENSTLIITGDTVSFGKISATAEANEGYIFEKWTVNGEDLTEDYVISENCTIVAEFKPEGEYYTVKFVSDNEDYGEVSVSYIYVPTDATYTILDDIIISGELDAIALANSGYVFDKWTVDGNELPEEGVIPGDCTVTAVFKPFVADPEAYYLVFPSVEYGYDVYNDYCKFFEDDDPEYKASLSDVILSAGDVIRVRLGTDVGEYLSAFNAQDPATAAAATIDKDGNAVIKADGTYIIRVDQNGLAYIEITDEEEVE